MFYNYLHILDSDNFLNIIHPRMKHIYMYLIQLFYNNPNILYIQCFLNNNVPHRNLNIYSSLHMFYNYPHNQSSDNYLQSIHLCILGICMNFLRLLFFRKLNLYILYIRLSLLFFDKNNYLCKLDNYPLEFRKFYMSLDNLRIFYLICIFLLGI